MNVKMGARPFFGYAGEAPRMGQNLNTHQLQRPSVRPTQANEHKPDL